jgi:tetratricopeptide (TPR) repeat protein
MASSPRFSSRLASSLLAGLMMFGICMLPASANSVLEAEKLLRLKQPRQALEQIELFLAKNPNDPQGRFFKGLILTELNRTPEAISMFQKLTEDYPELPEPYNNLAVLYAQQKQYDKAKTALEMAIRTHPSYAVAHENLGDIYARMATQAYDRALQLDSSNTGAQSKLNLIREMVGNSSTKGSRPAGASATAAAAAPPAVPVPTPTPASPAAATVASAKPAVPAKAPPSPVASVAVSAPTPAPVPEQAAKPATPPAPPASAETGAADADAIKRTVKDWAAAWARKDVKAYLGHYAGDFAVPGGKSRKAWETERQIRIAKPGDIDVRVESLQIKADGKDRVRASFRQHYRAVSLKSSTNKTLILVRHGERWLIQQERIGG